MKGAEKEIVMERLRTMPANMRLMIGDAGKFAKEELLAEVERETDTGELIVQIYMNGLKSFKNAI